MSQCVIQIMSITAYREFIGPIAGGALTEVLDFQTSAVVGHYTVSSSVMSAVELLRDTNGT